MSVSPLLMSLVFFSIAGLPSYFSADLQYEKCRSPLRCGSAVFPNITYPFWGTDIDKPNYCGQSPSFKLSCEGDQNLTLAIRNLKLRVISANLANQTITVADNSWLDGGCPEFWNFTGNGNYTLNSTTDQIEVFTDCPVRGRNALARITCQGSNGEQIVYHVLRSSDSETGCRKFAEIPMLRSVKNELQQSNLSLEEALQKGFQLRYTVLDDNSCGRCTASAGICGSESENFRCLCADRPHNSVCNDIHFRDHTTGANLTTKIVIGVTSGAIATILVITALNFEKLRKCCVRDQNLDALVPLKRYSYAQVKKITKSFRHQVGKGGFGIVYGGNLGDGRKVAVKVLKDSKGKGEDFINEVASMSRTSHVNIVTLLGFCYEGSKRAIIYEFLENGSLDKFISNKISSNVNWSALYEIALGIARGIEYLHNGCISRIVHFDIKPQNVLLDENLCPKVSDFGLAKLCENKESILSSIETRGTIGYIAPEVFSRMYGRVSHKSDVYSYGMLVLEMIGARNKTSTEDSASNTSSMYFPEWIYKDLEKGNIGNPNGSGINSEEEEIAKKMTLVGLWCIQSSPSNRPPMNRVVEMLEGSLDALQVPPKPVLQQVPAATLLETSWISEENSSPSLVMM